MIYRVANISDVEDLAQIHLECGNKQVGGFMHKLGLPFLRNYYRIHLYEKDSIIIIAEDANGSIHGFVSGTLAAEQLLKALRKNQVKLILSLLPVFLKSPGLLSQLKARYDFVLLKSRAKQYGITKGPRIDYWAWRIGSQSNTSIFLFRNWLNTVFSKGITSIKGEVDLDNNILGILTYMGARKIKELRLNDGRTRYIIEFVNPRVYSGFVIRNMLISDLKVIVQIHIKAFPEFFLTFMGEKFLLALYKNFILNKFSICIVVEKDSLIKGFAVGNLKPVDLFRKMLLKRGYIFLWHSFKTLFRDPVKVTKRIFYALSYRGECPEGYSNPALLSSIGVDPSEGSRGIGSHLIRAFCWEAFSKGSDVVYLTTDKYKNDPVNNFYIKNGFQLLDSIEQNKDRILNRYIKLPDEKSI